MKTVTTSTDKGASAAAGRGTAATPQLKALPAARGPRSKPAALAAKAPARPSGRAFRIKDRLASVLLLVTLVGAGWMGIDWGTRYWGELLRTKHLESTLISVSARQRKFVQQNEAYAGSLQELKVRFPTEVYAGVQLASGWIGGKPSYFAEYCDGVSCRALDASGTMRSGMRLELRPGKNALPPLTEGEGRFFAQLSKTRKAVP